MLAAGKISETTVAKLKASYNLLHETLKWYVILYILMKHYTFGSIFDYKGAEYITLER